MAVELVEYMYMKQAIIFACKEGVKWILSRQSDLKPLKDNLATLDILRNSLKPHI